MNKSIFCSQDLFADLEGRKEIYREDVVDTWDGMLSLEEIQQVCYSDINGVLFQIIGILLWHVVISLPFRYPLLLSKKVFFKIN